MNRTLASLWLAVAAALVGAVAGCSTDEATEEAPDEGPLAGDVVVSIPKDVDARAIAARRASLQQRGATYQRSSRNDDFYLAIRRNSLGAPWFFSVYLKELAPFGPSPGTLGTKVVRFRVQNGKLFMFDADHRRATSDVFSPELIIDAFPIVESRRFNSMPGSGSYVLIDPAAGFNRFSALADLFATGPGSIRLETELAFVQRFKRYHDGASYEQVITTYAEAPIGIPGDVERNELRLAATLGISLRTYSETPEYQAIAAPPAPHYFLGEPYHIPNTGRVARDPVHWSFHPGMRPVQWLISPVLAQISADPALGGADLVAAAKRGIESWNAVFGYPVFTAELDSGSASFAEDRVNYLIVDPDSSKGFAYADWRTNPNTGEIRGASVYFGGGFFTPFEDDEPEEGEEGGAAAVPAPRARTKLLTLQWQDEKREPLCVMWGRDYQARPESSGHAQLPGKEKLEKYIQYVVTHEIGHILGLRHNFKGSLMPPTSSVMEYSIASAAISQPVPGPYDHQAVRYLYGLSPQLPTLPFCTDEQTVLDPSCVRFDDPTPSPLADYQIPQYALFRDRLLDGAYPTSLASLIVQLFGSEVLGYARVGAAADAAAAWTAMLDGVRAPVSAAQAAAADALTAAVYKELYLDTTGAIRAAPRDAAVVSAIAADARSFLINDDRSRSFATRRLLIDALERAQNIPAYLALIEARAALAAGLPALGATDRALTQDLIARIDAASSPYFE